MITQWDHEQLKKKIEELKTTLNEKEVLLDSELQMNTYLKTQNESLKIHLDMLAQLNRKFADKLAKERVMFKNQLNKID
tara:strand:- start:633 stop:869 length:237 start_codon:yes stop_codon:yes gene_type:complete